MNWNEYGAFIIEETKNLLAIDSPSGMTKKAAEHVAARFEALGYAPQTTRKDGVLVCLGGRDRENGLLLEAHMDTLGGMVCQIKANGRLKITPIGGLRAENVETENCRVVTKFDGVIDVAAQTSDYWFRLYDHKTYQTYYGEDAGLTGTIETHPNPAGGKEIYLRVNLTLKNGIGVEAEYYGVPTAATADAMDEETLKPVKPFEPYIKFLDKDNKDMLYWPVTAMEVRHDPAYRDSYTGDLLSGYCFYFRNAFTESIDADNTTPMFFLPDSYLDHEGEIDLPAEGTNCKWNLRFQYMYLSSYNGYGYSDKDKYCMRCPEKAAVTVKQENKEWIFKFSMVDWGVFSTWNPDPTGTGNTLIIEFRGKAAKYSGSKPNDLADDFYKLRSGRFGDRTGG